MVVFKERETLALLDKYALLHSNPQNVTSSGIMLKLRARQELTLAMNQAFMRTPPWTESQVSVKFKNLRREYSELRWLLQQPGFRLDGAGLSDTWWRAIQAQRPTCHILKGKLPWPYYQKMAIITGDLKVSPAVPLPVSTMANVALPGAGQGVNLIAMPSSNGQENEQEREQQQSVEGQQQPSGSSTDSSQASLVFHIKRRRTDFDFAAATGGGISQPGREDSNRSGDSERRRSLAKAVEQSSLAAAGMARGFQELLAMFQEHTTRYRVLEQQATAQEDSNDALIGQRTVVLAVAQSLEQSTRATADLAQGYRELVSQYVRETGCELEREGAR